MNEANQVKNLLEFTAIFLSGDSELKMQSTEYYIEKYYKYIGIPLKITEKKTETYLEWSKIWGEDEQVNSIMNYLLGVTTKLLPTSLMKRLSRKRHWLVSVPPSDLLDTFREFVGDPNKINDKRYSYVHPIVKKEIYEEYIKEHIRYFKLIRILK